MSAQLLEVSLLGVGTVLRLERNAWSMVKWLRQATNEYAPLSPLPSPRRPSPSPAPFPRGSYIVNPLQYLEVATPENKSSNSTLSSISKKIRITSGS